jgi:protein-disulfide isomerase
MVSSKRKEIRERRLKKKRQQRITTIMIIVGGGLLLFALIALPNVINNLRPVGDITEITPLDRPMVDGRTMGNPDAPVMVEVYSDFQCPSCKVFAEEIESQIAENYVTNGDVLYIYRHFPFLDDQSAGNESDQSANASMCAAEQDRFWDYHDILFANWNGENQGAFNDRRLIAFAETLDLDMNQFEDCFSENRYKTEIDSDFTNGRQLNVTGTPTVFVNEEVVTPGFVPSFEDMQSAIDAELIEFDS